MTTTPPPTTTSPPESSPAPSSRDGSDPATDAPPAPGRDTRQRGLVPPEELARTHAVVVGVGAIGRQVALQLAAMGLPRLTLVDFDRVEPVNLGPQGWLEADLGRPKVEAAGALCRQVNPQLDAVLVNERWRRSTARDLIGRGAVAAAGRNVVFCCVDTMAARTLVWETARYEADLFVDGRMAAETIRVLAVHDDGSHAYYPTQMFSDAEAHQGACTARSTIYTSNVAAGLMVQQLAMWLRGMAPVTDQVMNLRAAELTVMKD